MSDSVRPYAVHLKHNFVNQHYSNKNLKNQNPHDNNNKNPTNEKYHRLGGLSTAEIDFSILKDEKVRFKAQAENLLSSSSAAVLFLCPHTVREARELTEVFFIRLLISQRPHFQMPSDRGIT